MTKSAMGSTRWFLASAATLWLAAAATGACGASGDGDNGSSSSSGSGASSSSSTGQGGDINMGGFTGHGGGSGGLDECAAEAHEGKQDPLDLVIMLDKSGSMAGTVNNVTVWQLVTDALNGFVQSPDSENLGVGLQYFPILDGPCGACDNSCPSLTCVNNCCATSTGVTCNNNGQVCPTGGLCVGTTCFTSGGMATCNGADYAQLAVPIATLPGNAGAITASLSQNSPDGLTPTAPALSGAIQAATTWATSHPDHIVAVVLATDGVPTECSPQDIGQIANIAGAAANANPSVLTFVIGIGDLTALNSIAASGGTGSAFIVQPNGNTTQQLIDALNAIRGTLLSCEFDIPQPDVGQLDFNLVNVELTLEGQAATVIPKVDGIGNCDPLQGGWYYDDPAAPSQIVMCPATCDLLKSGAATIDIVLGCATIVR